MIVSLTIPNVVKNANVRGGDGCGYLSVGLKL
jgi:hypothetical protein